MFIAVVIDEKTQTLPTIFYLGMTNNIDYCIWFLMRLKEALRDAREVSFIINMDNVITSSLGQLFPNFYHVYCCKCLALHLLTIVVETEHLNICSSVHANHILQTLFRLTPNACEVPANTSYAISLTSIGMYLTSIF
uniref:MULE transposase domain-containing protein n=1 Tax=Lactuca sativa TaxID=4236 RepID=A0A9R1WLS5_LACSA|nr:hypothetical protein LSAT_V11C100014900 [Lactuca sativa]